MTKKQKKTRDDFSSITIRLLRERVSDFCSKPDCRVSTRGASSNQKKTTSIGIAAHITAAASGPGAARYDASLTSDQRKHYDNGIWLCQTCSRLIDADENRFPVSLLKEWKEIAERYSQNHVGKQFISKDESNEYALDKVIEHVLGNDLNILTSGAVDIINHYDKKIQLLDPRFNIKTNIVDGCINRIITPLSNDIKLTMHMPELKGKDFNIKLNQLEKFGEEFEVSADDIIFKGSKLFESITSSCNSGSKLLISPPSKIMDGELFVVNEKNKQSLSSFKCKVFFGQEAIIIKAVTLNNFIEISTRFNIYNSESIFNYKFKTSEWLGRDIQKIPFFHKLKKSLPTLMDNGNFHLEVTDQDCNSIELGNTTHASNRDIIDNFICLVDYIDMARIIAEKSKTSLTYQYFEADTEDMSNMYYLCSLIKSPLKMEAHEFKKNPEFSIEVENIEQLQKELCSDEYGNIRIDESIPLNKILGQKIVQPVVRHQFNKVKPKILSSTTSQESVINVKIELLFDNEGSYHKYLAS